MRKAVGLSILVLFSLLFGPLARAPAFADQFNCAFPNHTEWDDAKAGYVCLAPGATISHAVASVVSREVRPGLDSILISESGSQVRPPSAGVGTGHPYARNIALQDERYIELPSSIVQPAREPGVAQPQPTIIIIREEKSAPPAPPPQTVYVDRPIIVERPVLVGGGYIGPSWGWPVVAVGFNTGYRCRGRPWRIF